MADVSGARVAGVLFMDGAIDAAAREMIGRDRNLRAWDDMPPDPKAAQRAEALAAVEGFVAYLAADGRDTMARAIARRKRPELWNDDAPMSLSKREGRKWALRDAHRTLAALFGEVRSESARGANAEPTTQRRGVR